MSIQSSSRLACRLNARISTRLLRHAYASRISGREETKRLKSVLLPPPANHLSPLGLLKNEAYILKLEKKIEKMQQAAGFSSSTTEDNQWLFYQNLCVNISSPSAHCFGLTCILVCDGLNSNSIPHFYPHVTSLEILLPYCFQHKTIYHLRRATLPGFVSVIACISFLPILTHC